MDEAQLQLAISKVEERVVFRSVVCMSAGFCDRGVSLFGSV